VPLQTTQPNMINPA